MTIWVVEAGDKSGTWFAASSVFYVEEQKAQEARDRRVYANPGTKYRIARYERVESAAAEGKV